MADSERTSAASPRLGSILVPVDGSEVSERALEYAAHLNPERVVLLRVEVDEPPEEHFDPTDPYERWRRDHLSQVVDELERQARAYVNGIAAIEPKIRFGNPAEQVMAEGLDHDLIVMGASGKGAAGRLLFGSVTDRVMRYSVTPTIVVRGGKHGTALERPARVVVPLDGSELAERALPVAVRMARALSVPIRLIRCIGMDEVLQTIRAARISGDKQRFAEAEDPYALGREVADAEASTYLDAVRERIAAEVGVSEVVCDRLGGTAAFELLEDIQPDDLVVMTSRGQGGLKRWMIGSVAQKMVHEAEAPVLLVPVGRSLEGQR